MRLRQIDDMDWDEFATLLSGLTKGPLIDYVRIRSEQDQKVIKKFSSEEKKIRTEWENRQLKYMTEEEKKAQMNEILSQFILMAVK
jgi:hypothetical protein